MTIRCSFLDNAHLDNAAEACVRLYHQRLYHPVQIDGLQQVPEQVVLRIGDRSRKPEPQSHLIMVVVHGEHYRREWRMSETPLRNYADKIGAELIVIDDLPAGTPPALLKSRALARIPAGRRVLLIDVDVIVQADSPDLFELVPPDAIGAYIEDDEWAEGRELIRVTAPDVHPRRPIFVNTGVLVLPPSFVERLAALDTSADFYAWPNYEQAAFNIEFHLHGFPVFNISRAFNYVPSRYADGNSQRLFFTHFAGASSSYKQATEWRRSKDGYWQKKAVDTRLNRLIDLHNERSILDGTLVTLVPATALFAQNALLHREEEVHLSFWRSSLSEGAIVAGPYWPLRAGRYSIEFAFSPLSFYRQLGETAAVAEPRFAAFSYEIVGNLASIPVRERIDIDSTAAMLDQTFAVAQDLTDLDVRLFFKGGAFAFYGLVLRRL